MRPDCWWNIIGWCMGPHQTHRLMRPDGCLPTSHNICSLSNRTDGKPYMQQRASLAKRAIHASYRGQAMQATEVKPYLLQMAYMHVYNPHNNYARTCVGPHMHMYWSTYAWTSAAPHVQCAGPHVQRAGPHVQCAGPRKQCAGPHVQCAGPHVQSAGPHEQCAGLHVQCAGPL